MDNKVRCAWLDDSQIYKDYHDYEWGREVHDDDTLFEMLTLESFQAGLSWITILKKREAFRLAFDAFKVEKVALYDEKKIEELLINEGIIRHRGKIVAAINNAKLFLQIQKTHGTFDAFLWKYVDYKPIISHHPSIENLPARTEISDKISKDFKKLGFKFLGSTTVYAFMQAIGMINDHTTDCFVYKEMFGENK